MKSKELEDNVGLATRTAHLAMKLGQVYRATKHPDGKTPESDTTHTVMLVMVACTLCPAEYDRGRVAELATVHDMTEVVNGDVDTTFLSETELADKKAQDAKDLERLLAAHRRNTWLCDALMEYEAQETPEARYVRFLDKMLPKLTHIMNSYAALAEGKRREDVAVTHDNQLQRLLEQYPEFSDSWLERLMAQVMRLSEAVIFLNPTEVSHG